MSFPFSPIVASTCFTENASTSESNFFSDSVFQSLANLLKSLKSSNHMLFRKGFSSDTNAFSLEKAPNPSTFFNTVNNNVIVILLPYFCNIQINSNLNQGKFPKHFS